MAEIQELAKLEGQDINQAKEVLAFEATKLLHGEKTAEQAKQSASKLFVGGDQNSEGNEPIIELSARELAEGLPIIDFLSITKIGTSKTEARRLVQQGGITVNSTRVDDAGFIISSDHFSPSGCLVKKGKKSYFRVKLV